MLCRSLVAICTSETCTWPVLSHLRFPLAQMSRRAAAFAGEILVRLGCGNIKLLSVFLHHALRVEDRRDAANRFAHQLQPGKGKFAVRLGVVKRDEWVLE